MSTVKEYYTGNKAITTLGIAAAGVYGTAPNEWSKDSAVRITFYDTKLTPYFGDMAEGAVVIDKRPCIDHPDFYKMVIAGPMLRESLPAGHKKGFDDKEPVPCENVNDCKGFDYIALDLYVRLWEDMGAKVGYRRGNKIVWNNGSESAIPAAKDRYQDTDI